VSYPASFPIINEGSFFFMGINFDTGHKSQKSNSYWKKFHDDEPNNSFHLILLWETEGNEKC
jgi:hypothetical protein